MSSKMHKPGIIHTWTFDQVATWIDAKGREHFIPTMDVDHAKNCVLFLLRNATRFENAYDMARYREDLENASDHGDPSLPWPQLDHHEAQRWIMVKPVFRALVQRVWAP